MPQNDSTPGPLGPIATETGVRFSLYSEHATAVDLCLFDSEMATKEARTLPLRRESGGVWRVEIPGLQPGALYGFRVHGPYRPAEGHRFNPSKILIDPYARALGRPMQWHSSLQSVPQNSEDYPDRPPNQEDSAPYAPLARVIDSAFDWEEDRPPGIPWDDTVLYETHVKGITQQQPEVPEALRGTFAGLASEPVLEHLTRLGVTTIELLPVTQGADERHLHESGLSNYWGYNPLLPFAPEARFASAGCEGAANEFRQMVKTLHRAGLEVILDLVFNHSAEGDLHGPTVSLRGIDNRTYYRMDPEQPSGYANWTGCGNTLNLHHPHVRRWVLDCLRYWVTDMHVDGFRLDLAVTVGRGQQGFDPEGPFFQAVRQDPVLSPVKWIAEPWDLGPDGYQLSRFPAEWSEWNDQFRRTARRYWRGDCGQTPSLIRRLAGSRDLFAERPLRATVNYITSHDGFTLNDLVSYAHKHNEANGEDNRDGSDHNDSCNHGIEGPTDDTAVNHLRLRQKKNLIATLLLAAGTPMISGGDEIGRSQNGNNNAYCQDNPIGWYDWNRQASQTEFLEFTRLLIQLRKQYQWHLLERQWFRSNGDPVDPEGHFPEDEPGLACLMIRSHTEIRADLLVLWNGGEGDLDFHLPGDSRTWKPLLDTSSPVPPVTSPPGNPLKNLSLPGKSLTVLVCAGD